MLLPISEIKETLFLKVSRVMELFSFTRYATTIALPPSD